MRPFVLIAAALLAGALVPAASAQDAGLSRIAQRGQLNIGFREDAPPFSFLDGKRQPIGYSVDLCRAMADQIRQDMGKPTLRTKWIVVPADQLERVVSSGGVDLMCAGTSNTTARRMRMAFSPPVFISSVRFMVRTGDKLASARDLKGRTVAVLGRTTTEPAVKAFSDSEGLDLKFSRVVSPDAALSQLQLKQAAAFARDDVLLLNQQAMQAQPGAFVLLPEKLSTEVIAIALPKGDEALQRAVDQALAKLVRAGQVDVMYERWFVKPHEGARAGLNLPMPPELKAELDKLR